MSFDDLFPPSRGHLLVDLLRRRVGSTSEPGLAAPAPSPDPSRGAVVTMLRSGDIAQRADTIRQQADAADAEPLDVSTLRDYSKGRKEASERALMMALAAQQAGPGFQPVAEHFLSKARSNAQPTKLDHGLLADGEYVADPAYGRQRRIDALRRQADGLDRLAVTAASAEERAEAQRRSDELRRELASAQREQTERIEAGRREDRAVDRSLRADLVAAQRTERERREAESRDGRAQTTLDRAVADLSKRGEDIAPLITSAQAVEDMLAKYGTKSIPGVGFDAMIPGMVSSTEANVNRARVQAVANALLKAQSGAAVTLSESERLAAETLANGRYSEADFRAAWPLLRAKIDAATDNLLAGFRPEVVDEYRKRGGNLRRVTAGGATGSWDGQSPAGALSPQERAELEALRGRFGGQR